MNIPATPEEAKELEKKIAANQAAGDWVEDVFPLSGLPNTNPALEVLKKIGGTRLPKSK
jgi:hypothetical protein